MRKMAKIRQIVQLKPTQIVQFKPDNLFGFGHIFSQKQPKTAILAVFKTFLSRLEPLIYKGYRVSRLKGYFIFIFARKTNVLNIRLYATNKIFIFSRDCRNSAVFERIRLFEEVILWRENQGSIIIVIRGC